MYKKIAIVCAFIMCATLSCVMLSMDANNSLKKTDISEKIGKSCLVSGNGIHRAHDVVGKNKKKKVRFGGIGFCEIEAYRVQDDESELEGAESICQLVAPFVTPALVTSYMVVGIWWLGSYCMGRAKH